MMNTNMIEPIITNNPWRRCFMEGAGYNASLDDSDNREIEYKDHFGESEFKVTTPRELLSSDPRRGVFKWRYAGA